MNPIIADPELGHALEQYCEQVEVSDLGTICALLFVARAVRTAGGIPTPQQLLAQSGAQIRGLHRSAVKDILLRYGITDLPVMEVGRTNMWNVYRLRKYLELLDGFEPISNEQLIEIEQWWVDRYRAALNVPRLTMQASSKGSLHAAIDHLVRQTNRLAEKVVRSDKIYRGDTLQLSIELLALAAVDLPDCKSVLGTDAELGTPGTVLQTHAIQVDIDPNEDSVSDLDRHIGRAHDWLLITLGGHRSTADYLISKHRMHKKCKLMTIEQFLYFLLLSRSGFMRTNQWEILQTFANDYNRLADVYGLAPGLRVNFTGPTKL